MDPGITMISEEEATEVGPNDIVIHLVNPYKCGICELEFLEKSVFKEHMFSHLEQIKQERPSSQIVMTVALPPETPGGVTVTRDILQLGEDGSIKQVLQPPNSITLNQVQPLRELEEAGVIKLDKPKPSISLLSAEGLGESGPIMNGAQAIVPQEFVPPTPDGNSAPQPLVAPSVVNGAMPSLGGHSLLKDTLVKSSDDQNGVGLEAANPALVPNKDGTFSFAFKASNEEMQHIQIIRSDGIKTEVLMELGQDKQDMVQPVRTMRMTGRMGGANKNNECDICGKILSSSTNLMRHKMYHSAERPFVCEVCNKGFKDISNLKKHTLIHKRVFPCHLCKKSFLRKSQLEIHLRKHESRTTLVKTGNTSKEVTVRTFVDADGSRVEEMSMTALGGQTFEYKNRIMKAKPSDSLDAEIKYELGENNESLNSAMDSSVGMLQRDQNGITDMRQNQAEGEKRMDKLFTVTMDGLQETPLPLSQLNGDQNTDPAEDQAAQVKFPPTPDEFVKVYQCGHCGKRTVQRGNMMRHLIHHMKDRPFACDECPKRFVDKGELFKHKKTHSKPYRCPQCNGAFAHNVQLMKHLQRECLGNVDSLNYTVMEDGQTYKCDICGVEMKRLGNMIKHVGTHNIDGNGGYNRKPNVTLNLSPGKPNAPYFYDSKRKAFFCGFCPKSFWKKANVVRHIEFHMKKGEQKHESKQHKCDECDLAFSRKLFLHAHKRKHNSCEVPVETADYALLEDKSGYYCKHCNKTLPKKYRMMSHVKKHVSGRQFECMTCNMCFSTAHLLLKHKKIHKKLFVCKKCGENFSSKLSLSLHLKRNHPQQPSFFPSIIPPLASRNETQDGSETFPCSHCGAPFSRMVIKLNHEKKCREESKVLERLPDGAGYKCKICGKTATLKHNLMVHVRKHAGVKIIDVAGKIVLDGSDASEEVNYLHITKESRKAMQKSPSTKKRKLSAKVASREGSESGESKDKFTFQDDSLDEDVELEDTDDDRYTRTPGGYACMQCRRKFTDKDTLTRHLESHEHENADNHMNSDGDFELYKDGMISDKVTLGETKRSTSQPDNMAGKSSMTVVLSEDLNQSADSEVKSSLEPKPALKKVKKTPVVSVKRLEESLPSSPIITPSRSGSRPARAQKIPSRFLE